MEFIGGIMSKILINSQGPHVPNGAGVNTAFAKVAYSVCSALAPKHDVGHICHDHQGLSFEFQNKYWIHRGNKNFAESASELQLHVESRKHDYVLGIGEAWGMYPYKDINFGDTQLLMHIPIDGEPCDSTLATVAQMADLMIPTSHYGKAVLNMNNIGGSEPIPHSYDPTIYYPFKQLKRDDARAKFNFTDDLFVIGFVGRQQERKNLMALIVAFEKFARDKPNVRLLLNTTIDKYSDFNLVHLAKFMGLADKVLVIKTNNMSETDMASMYNAMDLYVSTSCSEGFNMPVLEAQACGVPCAVSNYSAHVELVKNHGDLIKVADYRPMANNIVWAYVDIDNTVEIMNKYYNSVSTCRKNGAAAHKFVSEFYTTDIVNKLWLNLFDKYDDIKEAAESILPVRRMKLDDE